MEKENPWAASTGDIGKVMLDNNELSSVLYGSGFDFLMPPLMKLVHNAITEPVPLGKWSRDFDTYEDFIQTYNSIA